MFLLPKKIALLLWAFGLALPAVELSTGAGANLKACWRFAGAKTDHSKATRYYITRNSTAVEGEFHEHEHREH